MECLFFLLLGKKFVLFLFLVEIIVNSELHREPSHTTGSGIILGESHGFPWPGGKKRVCLVECWIVAQIDRSVESLLWEKLFHTISK